MAMPYVNIRVTKEGVTQEQKLQLIEGATDLLQRVLNKNPATTFVIIDEVEMDNWGVNRQNVTTLRQREAAARGAK
jgi:4-oxalocrotonate tautomerase